MWGDLGSLFAVLSWSYQGRFLARKGAKAQRFDRGVDALM
jgi:hypothetical protein